MLDEKNPKGYLIHVDDGTFYERNPELDLNPLVRVATPGEVKAYLAAISLKRMERTYNAIRDGGFSKRPTIQNIIDFAGFKPTVEEIAESWEKVQQEDGQAPKKSPKQPAKEKARTGNTNKKAIAQKDLADLPPITNN